MQTSEVEEQADKLTERQIKEELTEGPLNERLTLVLYIQKSDLEWSTSWRLFEIVQGYYWHVHAYACEKEQRDDTEEHVDLRKSLHDQYNTRWPFQLYQGFAILHTSILRIC